MRPSGVRRVGAFFVATALRGGGAAQHLYHTLRPVVAAGNVRAERLGHARGLRAVGVRTGVDTGGRSDDLRRVVRPLAGGALPDDLALAPLDRPGSTLP